MASDLRPHCPHLEQLLRFCEQNVHKLPGQFDVRQAVYEYGTLVSEATKTAYKEMTNPSGTAVDKRIAQSPLVTTTDPSRPDTRGRHSCCDKSTDTEPSEPTDADGTHASGRPRRVMAGQEFKDAESKLEKTEMLDTIKLQQIKISELTRRLSSYASKQLSEGNPDIVDLSDSNRPTKLAERFSECYDNEWSDAYETIKSGHDEMTTIALLLKVVMRAYTFCTDMAEDQLTRLVGQLDSVLEKTERKDKNRTYTCTVTFGAQDKQRHLTASRKFAKEYLRTFGNEVAKSIHELFLHIEAPKIFQVESHTKLPESIQTYCTTCADIVWLMVIQDPPITLVLAEPNEKINKSVFNLFARKGATVKQPVWPAVHLHDGGALISKGYVYPQ